MHEIKQTAIPSSGQQAAIGPATQTPGMPQQAARPRSALCAHGLIKYYRGSKILDQVDVTVERPSIVGLLGSNGAGKTTCFNIIIGLVRQDEGRVTLDGKDLSRLPIHERTRRGIGYLPQEHSVFRRLSVRDNLLAVLELSAKYSAAERGRIADRLLEEFNIADLRDAPAIQLSGGEQRRVEIARALSLEPDFILLDEPFAGVDPIAVQDIQNIISLLKQRGIGILITDHNVRETLRICDYAYLLHAGRMLVAGSPAELMNHPAARTHYLGREFAM